MVLSRSKSFYARKKKSCILGARFYDNDKPVVFCLPKWGRRVHMSYGDAGPIYFWLVPRDETVNLERRKEQGSAAAWRWAGA